MLVSLSNNWLRDSLIFQEFGDVALPDSRRPAMHADFDRLRSRIAYSLLLFALYVVGHLITFATPVSPDVPQNQVSGEDDRVKKEIPLGEAYLTGEGAPHDLNEAAYWYEKAA